jgi:two-component system cell cycle response regulator DivK
MTVLLVHASPDDRQMYAEYLRLNDLVVTEAATTDDGWAKAATADVVVTGLMVPGSFDGLELVRRLRRDPATATKPIVVLTARVMQADRDAAEDAGCDVFLPKPCLPDVLLAEIRRVLAHHSSDRTRT